MHALECDHRFNLEGTEIVAMANTKQARDFLDAWHSNITSINRHVDLDAHYEAVLGRARRQHQDCFDDNDATIGNLLAEENRLQKAYVDHPTDDNRGAFCRCRRLVQQRLLEMTDGRLLNQRRMHFQSRVSTTTVHELLFADDCALNTTSEEDMKRIMDLYSAACENFGLVINTQKTVVMHQPPPHSATAPDVPPQISVNGTQLQVVENFLYLCSTISRSTQIDDEVPAGFRKPVKASVAFKAQSGIVMVSN
ncbi:hypothetical protein SprV_0802462800 [Sparganum proliferum]